MFPRGVVVKVSVVPEVEVLAFCVMEVVAVRPAPSHVEPNGFLESFGVVDTEFSRVEVIETVFLDERFMGLENVAYDLLI